MGIVYIAVDRVSLYSIRKAYNMAWRGLFLAAGVLILTGGPMHPRDETMHGMLANPAWFPSHALVTLGYAAFMAGLAFVARRPGLPARTAWWTRVAMLATAAQTVEMILHTAAMADHGNLVAGRATPILTTHLALTAVVYPLWGMAVAGWISAAARDRAIGSAWIAPLGMIGALGHGFAGP